MPEADNKTPAFAALGLVAIGIVIAAVQGFVHGSIGGGIIALLGTIPSCFGMWKGIQQETQGTLGLSVVALIASLLVGGLLIVLRVIHWVS
jgi:hypothetical protein